MSQDRTRIARRALLALLLVVSGAVAWSLRKPSPRPGATQPAAAASPGQGTTVDDMSFLQFREGSRKVEVKARAMVGREGDAMRLQGVTVTFPFEAEGREVNATITADECLYQPSPQRASFRGNVKVRTDDGFEMESENLKLWSDERRVFAGELRFRRKDDVGHRARDELPRRRGAALQANVRSASRMPREPRRTSSPPTPGRRGTNASRPSTAAWSYARGGASCGRAVSSST
jgi:hypothetical protein